MMAEEWGTPPYEIAGGSKIAWRYRWTLWHNKREQNKSKQSGGGSRGNNPEKYGF